MPKRRKGARRQQQKLKKEGSLAVINVDDDDEEENRQGQDNISVIKQKDYASRYDTKNDDGIVSQTTKRLTRLATSSLTRKIKVYYLVSSLFFYFTRRN